MEKIVNICTENDIFIIADEIHCDIIRNNVNNFDLLRLFAATQVVLSHASVHLEHNYFVLNFLSLFPGVPIFFFLSDYLIYGSY